MCLFVPEDLTNRRIVMDLSSHRSWQRLKLFQGRIQSPSEEGSLIPKMTSSPKYSLLIFFSKLKLKEKGRVGGVF